MEKITTCIIRITSEKEIDMSVLEWHIRKILLILSWVLVYIGLVFLLPDHRLVGFIIAVLFCWKTNKVFHHCPHCGKLIDLYIFVTEEKRCIYCGCKLTDKPEKME